MALKTRIITGVLLIVFGLVLFFGTGPYFPLILWVIFALMMVEWVSARQVFLTKDGTVAHVNPDQYGLFIKCASPLAFLFVSGFFFFLKTWAFGWGGLFWILAFCSLLVPQRKVTFLTPSLLLYFVLGLSLLVPAWVSATWLFHVSPWLLLYVVLVIAASDTGAYFIGRAFGKHALAKTISPNKTWEGALGGLIAGLIVAFIYACFAPSVLHSLSTFKWLLSGILFVIAGVVGDLFESRMKRLISVKDFGKLLPGHGGWLDRFDSHLAGCVVAAIYFYWVI
jgi:phosphatidate cytidylyltransferase